MNMAWKAMLIAVVIASATWLWSANQETTNSHRKLLPSAVLVKEAPQANQPIDWDAIATGKPTSGNCIKWASFKESAAFKALSKEDMEASRNLYFDE